MPDSLHSRKCIVTVGLAPCRAVETEEEITTDEIVVPYDFVEVQDGVWHLELLEHLLHVFVGKKKIESADILYVRNACRVLSVIVFSIAKTHFSRCEIVESSGVVVAVRTTFVIVWILFLYCHTSHVYSMKTPVERQYKGIMSTQYLMPA